MTLGRCVVCWVVTIVLAIAAASTDSIVGTATIAEGVDGTITVPLPECDVSLETDDGFCRFTGTGIQQIGHTGEPSLPYKVVTVLLPPGADLSTVTARIANSKWTGLDGEWDVLPVPPLAMGDGQATGGVLTTDEAIVYSRDADIYKTDASFPVEPVVKVATLVMRGWKMAQVFYAPYAYNPVEKRIHRLSGDAIEVTFQRDLAESNAAAMDFTGAGEVREMTANFAEVAGEYAGYVVSSAAGRYVIITTSAIKAASSGLMDFVASKEARGFTVQVVTEETWQNHLANNDKGDAAAEHIRSWLQANYSNIDYVLLVGNPNPSTGDVPMKTCYCYHYDIDTNTTSTYDVPTDFYYAELTSNNWDSDHDGRYGEYHDDFSDNPPRAAEVAVGRIPFYGVVADLDSVLSSIIDYENARTASTSWRKNVLLPMNPSDAVTPGYQLGEEIKNSILIPNGWTYKRAYDQYNSYCAPEDAGYVLAIPEDTETKPCTIPNVTNAWNGSDFGGVFWWTHGSSTLAVDVMDTSAVAALDDDEHLSFAFQCSCSNGEPEAGNNLGYSLLKKACVSTVCASRGSWYLQEQDSFDGTATNSGMTFEYAQRLIVDKMCAGDALNDLKQDVVPDVQEYWMNYLDFNLYGCPAVGLFTSVPDQEAPSVLTYPADSVTITSLRMRANLASLGMADNASVSFQWGTTSGFYDHETAAEMKTSTGIFYADLSSLAPGTTVYYRAKADGEGDPVYGSVEKSCTTLTIPPSVTTGSATAITTDGARLNGNLLSKGTAENVTVSFRWGTAPGDYDYETVPVAQDVLGPFYFDLSSLAGGTTVYYRAKAVGQGSGEGEQKSFTTLVPPTVATNPATNETTTSATLNGNLTLMGTADNVAVSFEWGTTPGGPYTTVSVGVRYGTGSFSSVLPGLAPGTTYYYRAVADGDGGPVYGADRTFVTQSTPPSVATGGATSVTTDGARLNGNLTSLGTAGNVTVTFQWGTARGHYDHETSPVVRDSLGSFYFDLSGVASGTTFYYRAKAVGHGSDEGEEESFTTLVPPAVATDDVSYLTGNSVRLNGNLSALGTAESVTVSFEWKASGGSYTSVSAGVKDGIGPFSIDLPGLTPGIMYYCRAKAEGVGSPVYGTEKAFGIFRDPVIGSVNPSTVCAGQSLIVKVSGSGFSCATEVSFGSDIIVGGFQVVSDTELSVAIQTLCDTVLGTVDVSVTNPAGTGTLAKAFAITDLPPSRPWNASPADGGGVMTLTPTLSSSAFSHLCPARSHAASQWQVTTVSGDYSSPLFDSATDSANLISLMLPAEIMGDQDLYWWRVRFQDDRGTWSEWSAETSFVRPDFVRVALDGPDDIRVIDSLSRETGQVRGQTREGIPYSVCNGGTVTIASPTDSYRYEVLGTGSGPYSLTVTRLVEGQRVTWHATGIPISPGEEHEYAIDWGALSRGEPGVSIQIDLDGDGAFDRTALVKADVDGKESVFRVGQRGTPVWVWILLGIGLIAATAGLVVLSRVVAKGRQPGAKTE